MTDALIYGYLGGWVIASLVVALVAWRMQDEQQPAAHPVLLTIVAGAAWPLLIVALAEASAFAVTTEVLHVSEPQRSFVG